MSSLSRFLSTASPLCVALLLGACGKSYDKGRGAPPATTGSTTKPMPAAAQIALDAGNAAYKEKKMDAALASYRAAAAAAPTHAAPWFGVYMVAGAMNNAALADSAMAQVKALSQESAVLDEHARTAANPATAPSANNPLPPGHPAPATSPALPPGHPSSQTLPPAHPVVPARPIVTKPGTKASI